MDESKYSIKRFKDGSIEFGISDCFCFLNLSKYEIKELIQDLLKCLKPSVAGEKDKS